MSQFQHIVCITVPSRTVCPLGSLLGLHNLVGRNDEVSAMMVMMLMVMAVVVMMLMLRLLGSIMMPIAYDENLMPALCQVTDLAAHFILQVNFHNQSCNIEAN